MVEIDKRVMLSDFFDEGKSEEEIASLEKKSQPEPTGNGWPEAGIRERIAGVTGKKVMPLCCVDPDMVRASLKKLAD